MLKIWRYTWPLPWTLLGLTAAVAVRLLGGQWRRTAGAVEAYGGALASVCRRLPPACQFDAITLGHVIIGVDAPTLDAARDHEHVHLRQYERWGVLFVPVYLGASAWLWLRGGHPYRDNPFEREAYALCPIAPQVPPCADMLKVE